MLVIIKIMDNKTTGVQRPTDEEIAKVFKAEQDAALTFAKISREETEVQIKKEFARTKLAIAREAKREILTDLMAL